MSRRPRPAAAAPGELLEGLVVSAHGRHCVVETDSGARVRCHPRGKKLEVVVGDRVQWLPSQDEGTVERTLPRRNWLYRQDELRTKSFAANLDQVLILLAAEPEFSEHQLARALIACECAHIEPLIVLNKADLMFETLELLNVDFFCFHDLDIAPEGTRPHRALEDVVANTQPLRLLQRVLVPILVVISAVLFWRGHNAPGGGFIAALVAACAVAYVYMAKAADGPVSRPMIPVVLIGGGVLVATATGLLGYLRGEFLQPLYWELLGTKVGSSLVFDVGVYAAVLGVVMVAFNLLGADDVKEEVTE